MEMCWWHYWRPSHDSLLAVVMGVLPPMAWLMTCLAPLLALRGLEHAARNREHGEMHRARTGMWLSLAALMLWFVLVARVAGVITLF
jgi:hypothetical protein